MEAAIAPKWQEACSAEFERFSRENGLASYIATAKDLATRYFHVESGACEFVQAGDSEDQWIVVRIWVKGSTEEVLASKRQYTSQWVASVPAFNRHMVRLSFEIVE